MLKRCSPSVEHQQLPRVQPRCSAMALSSDCHTDAPACSLQGHLAGLLQDSGVCHKFVTLPDRLPGPANAVQSSLWAFQEWESMRVQGQKFFGVDFSKSARLALASGLLLTTDYSGIGCPEEALSQLVAVAAEESAQAGEDFPGPSCFQCLRAGDVSPHCRHVLQSSAGCFRPTCLHGNILERCPQGYLAQMKLSQGEASRMLNKRQQEQSCRSSASKRAAALDAGRAAVVEMSVYMHDVSGIAPDSVSAYCYIHKRPCPVIPLPNVPGLRMHVAGVTCVDWSSMGAGRQWLGDSCPVMMEWVRERLLATEEVVIAECVLGFDSDTLAMLLKDVYEMTVLRLSPVLFGEPVARQRKFMVLLRKGKLRWQQGISDYGVEDAFSRIFARTLCMHAESKFRAPKEHLTGYLADLAEKQGMPASTRHGKSWSCFQLATPAVRQSIQDHESALVQRCGTNTSMVGWLANLAQRPHFMPAVRYIIPALLRSSKLWIFNLRRWPTPHELLEVQNFNVFGADSSGRPDDPIATAKECARADALKCGVGQAISSLTPAQMQSVAGNGMNLRCIGAAVLFTLGCVEQVPEMAL